MKISPLCHTRIVCLSLAIACIATPTFAQSKPAYTANTLRAGFLQPPQQSLTRCYWWWLNGNTDEAAITRDLTEMHRKGIGGVLLVDADGSGQGEHEIPAGPEFGSPQWMKLYLHALKVAASFHIEVTLNAMSGWNLGGPDVTPAQASKLLTWTRTAVTEHYDGTLPMPAIKNGFYQQIAVLAYPVAHVAEASPIRQLRQKSAAAELGMSMPRTAPLLGDATDTANDADTQLHQVVNITAKVDASGHLRWQAPSSGTWEILRIGYTDSDARVSTSSGAWQGLAIDYLDRGAFDTYWSHTLVPILSASRPWLKTTLISLATDSWELGGTNWTGRFAAEFQKRRGYDPVPYLPILAGRIIGDRATSEKFLNDLRRTVGDLVTDHYDHFAERAAQYGLGIQCESGGPHGAPIDALETFRSTKVPQTEYWAESNEHRTTDPERYFTKEAASAADIYGAKFAAQEGMTTIGPQWSESLAADLKPSFDQALTEGMTRLVWHQFTSIPASEGLPGDEYFAGTHLNPNLTWWQQSDAFFLYLNRSQFLLQQGHAVDDVLYYYGDEVPNFVRLKADDPAHVLPGYDYDVTDEDALLRTLSIRSGSLSTPTGNQYQLLVLPTSARINLPSLERIAAYVHAGGSIAGPMPLAPTGILDAKSAARFQQLTQALWANCTEKLHTYGSGKVFCNTDTRSALNQLHTPQDFTDSTGKLDYIHRRAGTTGTGPTEIYFVRNGSAASIDTIATFRVANRIPELWNAIDGTIRPQKNFATDSAVTKIPLHLAPYGAIFVIFSKPSTAHPALQAQSTPPPSSSQNIPASQWTITFQPDRGAPANTQPLPSFTSWSTWSNPGIKYFSGTATYSTHVEIKRTANSRYFLTLADLHEICTVRVNGKPAGTIWAMPYRLDITDALKDGSNSLQLDVTNLWPNRIIGDAQPNVTHKFTHTNIIKYKSDSPLLPSGLTDPVAIETIAP